MNKKIAITTSSFGQYDPRALKTLEKNRLDVILNREGRTLQQNELFKLLDGCQGVIAGTEKYDKEVLEGLTKLRVISRCGIGIDNIDLDTCKKRGIKIFNTPDEPTRAVAELVIGLILSLFRKINIMDREIRNGIWKKRIGQMFADKEIGIIGFGRIGREVAKLSSAFGARVFYYDPFVTELESELFNVQRNEFKELLSHCDIISLHLPYTPGSDYVIGKKEFALMKQSSTLINCSRGGVVDENALFSMLDSKKISGAAVDVFESEPYHGPLQGLENVILTPHVGSYAKEARIKMELTAADNLIKGFKGI